MQEHDFENIVVQMSAILSGLECVNIDVQGGP